MMLRKRPFIGVDRERSLEPGEPRTCTQQNPTSTTRAPRDGAILQASRVNVTAALRPKDASRLRPPGAPPRRAGPRDCHYDCIAALDRGRQVGMHQYPKLARQRLGEVLVVPPSPRRRRPDSCDSPICRWPTEPAPQTRTVTALSLAVDNAFSMPHFLRPARSITRARRFYLAARATCRILT
jgi:hypothetical protein